MNTAHIDELLDERQLGSELCRSWWHCAVIEDEHAGHHHGHAHQNHPARSTPGSSPGVFRLLVLSGRGHPVGYRSVQTLWGLAEAEGLVLHWGTSGGADLSETIAFGNVQVLSSATSLLASGVIGRVLGA